MDDYRKESSNFRVLVFCFFFHSCLRFFARGLLDRFGLLLNDFFQSLNLLLIAVQSLGQLRRLFFDRFLLEGRRNRRRRGLFRWRFFSWRGSRASLQLHNTENGLDEQTKQLRLLLRLVFLQITVNKQAYHLLTGGVNFQQAPLDFLEFAVDVRKLLRVFRFRSFYGKHRFGESDCFLERSYSSWGGEALHTYFTCLCFAQVLEGG